MEGAGTATLTGSAVSLEWFDAVTPLPALSVSQSWSVLSIHGGFLFPGASCDHMRGGGCEWRMAVRVSRERHEADGEGLGLGLRA